MQAGEVVVMDIGALYDGYAADVTRTVPVSGTFSADQAAIYTIVRSGPAGGGARWRSRAPRCATASRPSAPSWTANSPASA